MERLSTIYPDKMFVRVTKADDGQTEESFRNFIKHRFHRYELVDYSNGSYLFKRKKESEGLPNDEVAT